MIPATHQEIHEHLFSLANPDIAAHSQHFFKTAKGEYGYGDKFLGIRVPVIRQAVNKYKTAPLTVTEKLLKSEYHEIRLFALLLWVMQFSKGSPDIKENIYELYLNNTKYINNLDLVDSSAHHIVGRYLEDRSRDILYVLSQSASLWERRVAIISTFCFIMNNDFDETLKLSKQLLKDPEDLIHKATGWMLREVGKRDMEKEIEFLNANYRGMPKTMLRYAIEKFNEPERQKYLNGRI
jgi:3-methyladenine DNA glycosylase AlkD